MQLVGVIVAFVVIIVFSFRKVSLAYTMCAATAVMALTSGFPAAQAAQIIWNAFRADSTLELAATVFAIGVFSTVMKETGYLDRMIQGLAGFLGNIKAAIMAVPAIIGSMPVLGGAAVSAPLVDRLGEGLDLSPDAKAAINLVFRHGMFFIFPLSPTLILAANMIGVSVGTLISKLWVYGVCFWVAGYWFLLRKAGRQEPAQTQAALALSTPEGETASSLSYPEPGGQRNPGFHDEETRECGSPVCDCAPGDCAPYTSQTRDLGVPNPRTRELLKFLRYGAPLLVALLLGIAFKVALWMSMMAGVVLALGLAYADNSPRPSLRTVSKGANLPQVAAMFWIMAFKEFATMSTAFSALVSSAVRHGVPPALLAVVLPLLFGYVSANHTTTIGVLLPVLIPSGISDEAVLYFTSVIYGAGFLAYFTSPLHLCQVLTCQYYGVDLPNVYKAYWPVILAVATVMLALAGIATSLM